MKGVKVEKKRIANIIEAYCYICKNPVTNLDIADGNAESIMLLNGITSIVHCHAGIKETRKEQLGEI